MIEITHLTKDFGGVLAVNNLSMAIEQGQIFGLVGPNGAGKTTTIRVLATLLEPSEGDVRIKGLSVWEEKRAIRGIIGYMPDSFGVYQDMTCAEYLAFFAAAHGVEAKKRRQVVGDLLELVDLGYKADAMVAHLSRGMKQRLGLARVLVHDPEVLILDEPASGLDPRARVEIREILKELKTMGKTILLSSHILHELSEICNRIAIVETGRLCALGTLDELRAKATTEERVVVEVDDGARARSVLESLDQVVSVEPLEADCPTLRVVLSPERPDPAPLAAALVQAGLALRGLQRERLSLEDVFMLLTRGAVA